MMALARPTRARGWALGMGVLALLGAIGGAAHWWWSGRAAALGDTSGSLEGDGPPAHAGDREIGIALPSWVTGSKPSESAFDVGRASKAMVERARSKVPLSSYQQAEDRALFTQGAKASAGPAYFHTAYWLAVGARLLGGDVGLVHQAQLNQTQGARWAVLPGGSMRTGNVTDIYRQAYELLRERASRTGNRQVAAAAGQLRFDDSAVKSSQANAADTNPILAVPKMLRADRDDLFSVVGRGAGVLRGLVTGERPAGMGGVSWWAWKWGIRVGVGMLVLFGLRVYFAPQYEAAKSVVVPVARRAARAAAAARASRAELGEAA